MTEQSSFHQHKTCQDFLRQKKWQMPDMKSVSDVNDSTISPNSVVNVGASCWSRQDWRGQYARLLSGE